MKKFNDNPSTIHRWEDIPKSKINKYRKTESVTEELLSESIRIENRSSNIENKSIKILEGIYKRNKLLINNNEEIKPHKNLYSIVYDVEILRTAYRKLSKNKGSMTPGAVNITADNINEQFLINLSKELKEEKFEWNPAKRIYIEKPGKKKKRPLGINDYKNKIVQESIRMILESIYEPIFENLESNSGFRPKRDCANAIENIKSKAKFANIVIEGDIVGAYDNVDHKILMKLLIKRIRDRKLLTLIYKGLKAGIMTENKYTDTFLGIPQGGVCSPILFNIYMHEFDLFINGYLKNYIDNVLNDDSKKSYIKETKEYRNARAKRARIQNKIKDEKSKENIIDKDVAIIMETIKENEKMFIGEEWNHLKKIGESYAKKRKANKNLNQNEEVISFKKEINEISDEIQRNIIINYKKEKLEKELKMLTLELKSINRSNIDNTKIRSYYHRYADDWTLWLRCTLEIALILKDKIKYFLDNVLKLELSDDKTKITILKKSKSNFLGFTIYRQKNDKFRKLVSTTGNEYNRRSASIVIDPDNERIMKRLSLNKFYREKKYFDKKNVLVPNEIGWLSIFEPQQIIEKFNQFMLGFGNYYITVISTPSKLAKYHYIYYYSCLKTLCCKLKISIKNLVRKYGYYDISNKESHYIIEKIEKKRYLISDLRICYNFRFNKKRKWITLLNYKEFMQKLLNYRKIYRNKVNNGEIIITPQINFLDIYKLNFRTKYKLNSHCIICGSTESPLHSHHIRKLNHGGKKKYKGYKAFDKVIASLNRKQITVCQPCHKKIHDGLYDGIKISDLYDVRLAIPENYIRMESEKSDEIKINLNNNNDQNPLQSSKSEVIKNIIIIDKKNRTYWNEEFHNFLVNQEKRANKTKTEKKTNNKHNKQLTRKK